MTAPSAPWTLPAIDKTTAGPSACQASGIADRICLGAARCAIHCATVPSTRLIATSSGTTSGGRSNSIGTSTRYDGTTYPAPIGNSTVSDTAYSPTSNSAKSSRTSPPTSDGTASGSAMARNSAAAPPSTISSKRLARRDLDRQESSSRRSTGSRARTSSSAPLWIIAPDFGQLGSSDRRSAPSRRTIGASAYPFR